jgi:hypothetical protein
VAEHGNPLPPWMQTVETVMADGHHAVPLVKAFAAKDAAGEAAMAEAEQKNIHQLHLENFFDAVHANSKAMLTCPAEVGYATAVTVLNAIPAIEKGRLALKAEDFVA